MGKKSEVISAVMMGISLTLMVVAKLVLLRQDLFVMVVMLRGLMFVMKFVMTDRTNIGLNVILELELMGMVARLSVR